MPLRVLSPPPSSPISAAPQSSDPTADDNASNDGRARTRTKLVSGDILTERGRMKTSRTKTTDREAIMQLAWSLKRFTDMWANVPQAVNVGRAQETLDEYETLSPTDEMYNQDEKDLAERIIKNAGKNKDRLVKFFLRIMGLFGEYRDYIDGLKGSEDRLFWKEVNGNADNGRNDDTGKLKDFGYAYVLKSGSLDPAMEKADKSNRGLKHAQLRREIIPMSVLHKYGHDDAELERIILARTFKLKHNNAPAFLYDKDLWDSASPDVLRQILFGPLAARAVPGKRKRGSRENNAKIAGVTSVTPAMIAYACVHARFYICTQDQFGEHDDTFSFKSFYYWIIDFFEEADADWVKETIQWWNDNTFGPRDDEDEDEDEDEDDETSFANILALQRARKTRAVAVSQTAGPSQTQPDSQYSEGAFSGLAGVLQAS